MTLTEAAVIVFGLFAGYWVVSRILFGAFLQKQDPKPTARAPVQNQQPHWCAILEVSEFASTEAIRAAYKRQIAKYHPDKVERLGAELKEFAGRKARDINLAYGDAMRMRGL